MMYLLAILHLALFYYLSIITADQTLFHGQVGRAIGQLNLPSDNLPT